MRSREEIVEYLNHLGKSCIGEVTFIEKQCQTLPQTIKLTGAYCVADPEHPNRYILHYEKAEPEPKPEWPEKFNAWIEIFTEQKGETNGMD